MFPEAPIYTLVHAPGRVDKAIERHPIHTSFIQSLPGAPRRFRRYLPLFPQAVESWDLSRHELIISTSHCVAKGVRTTGKQLHISYIHTPMRYLWDQLPQYLPRGTRGVLTPLAQVAVTPLRRWDVVSARRPDWLLANSAYVAARIQRVWGRVAQVVYPPVDVGFFAAAAEPTRRQGFLVVSALVPYKRVDLAVRVANALHLPLTVIGEGAERAHLMRLAGPTVRFKQGLDRAALRHAYANAQGLLFCGVEDFGIVPVEAMAAGCPVIGLGEGGLCETVVGTGPASTGVFFPTPDVSAVTAALETFNARRTNGMFARPVLAARARQFDTRQFVQRMEAVIATATRTASMRAPQFCARPTLVS